MTYPEKIKVFNRVLKKTETATYKTTSFGMLVYQGDESKMLYYIRPELVHAYL